MRMMLSGTTFRTNNIESIASEARNAIGTQMTRAAELAELMIR